MYIDISICANFSLLFTEIKQKTEKLSEKDQFIFLKM
jgi:hypothetical protein